VYTLNNHGDPEMKQKLDENLFIACASYSGFLVFGVIFSPMIILVTLLLLESKLRGQEHVILVPISMLFGMYTWLLGFRIRVTEDLFKYRDGLWRWHTCPLLVKLKT
jgi:hypothetical protein